MHTCCSKAALSLPEPPNVGETASRFPSVPGLHGVERGLICPQHSAQFALERFTASHVATRRGTDTPCSAPSPPQPLLSLSFTLSFSLPFVPPFDSPLSYEAICFINKDFCF